MSMDERALYVDPCQEMSIGSADAAFNRHVHHHAELSTYHRRCWSSSAVCGGAAAAYVNAGWRVFCVASIDVVVVVFLGQTVPCRVVGMLVRTTPVMFSLVFFN